MKQDWTVEFSAAELLVAATALYQHHNERMQWWNEQFSQADADLKAHGVEWRDNEVSGGVRHDIVIDPERSQRVNACRAKIDEHEKKAKTYATWVRFFEAAETGGGQTLALTQADMEFFEL